MNLKLCSSEADLDVMLNIVKEQDVKEYDCTFEELCGVLKMVHRKNPNFRSWVLYENEIPIGFISAVYDGILSLDVTITDFFIRKGYRGKGRIAMLVLAAKNWAEELDAKRVRWRTKIKRETWERRLGGKLEEERIVTWVRR